MSDISLTAALGRMVAIRQWFVWRLTWSPEDGKYLKAPVNNAHDPWPMDSALPHNWISYENACANVEEFRTVRQDVQFTLGFRLTEDCGYWLLDLDHCLSNGVYSAVATDWISRFPGCLFENSSSGDGAHVIGFDALPPHRNKHKATGTELYSRDRGIAFGLSGRAWGCADTPAGAAILGLAAEYFPPHVAGEDGDWMQPRKDWNGPADDAALIAKAIAAKSLAAKSGNKASFEDLWIGSEERLAKFYGPGPGNERDAALASHLAFWTGCDAPRMERLMRQSGLRREKWDQHRTYLRELTINNACANQKDVYKEPPRVDVAAQMYGLNPLPLLPLPLPLPAPAGFPLPAGATPTPAVMVTPEAKALIDGLLDQIHASPDWAHIHNVIIPAVRDAGVPPAFMPRLEVAINKRLELWDGKMPINKLRALLNPPRMAVEEDESDDLRPEWVGKYVYVRQGDCFHDIAVGVGMSRTSFNATHDRDMPIKGDGPEREDSVKWMLHRWNVPLVHDTMYYPGQPAVITHDGLQWANLYSEASHPQLQDYTPEGVHAIEHFQRHLWALCGQRERVYANLLAFMAHNVQFPGKKVRWVPIIKGTEGDGKTMLAGVMNAAMGGRNVASIGPGIVAAPGGFTDWAHGNAFVALEELYLEGKDRYKISNALKEFIANNDVSIHPKGGKPKKVVNTTNYAAFTNHTDAIPLDVKKDRRWFVIFTPFDTLQDMERAMGLSGEPEMKRYFDVMFHSLKREPGQWRRWLMSLEIPEWFSADGRAMATDEKGQMAASGTNDVESIARSIVEEGMHGVSSQIVSSAMLTSAMRQRAFADGVEIPKTNSLHHLLNRMGFVKVEKQVKWAANVHRVWTRPGIPHDPAVLRQMLDATRVTSAPGNGAV